MENKDTLENTIENYLKKETEKRGWICYKFESPGNKGVPDRIVVAPNGVVAFLETKRPSGGVHGKLQKWQMNRITTRGHLGFVVKNKQEVDEAIKEIEEKCSS